jgi:carbonic anhydrase
LESIKDEDKRFDRLVELNVIEQVFDLSKTSIIQNAWKERTDLKVHGWVYSLKTGLIKDLEVSFDNTAKLPAIYRIDSKIVAGSHVQTEEA